MKKLCLIALAAAWIFPSASQAQKSYVVIGKIAGLDNNRILWRYRDPLNNERLVFDSVECKNGSFTIQRTMQDDEPVLIVLFLSVEPYAFQPPLRVFVRNGDTVTVNGDVDSLEWAQVKGMKYNDQFNELKQVTKPDETAMLEIMQGMQMNNSNQQDKQKLNQMKQSLDAKKMAFIKQHPDYMVSAMMLAIELQAAPQEKAQMLAGFTDEVRKGQYGRLISDQMEDEKKTGAGATAIGFAKTDIDGKTVRLDDYKGKYVVLDFWGSWCGPCRAGNPHLKELYAKYKDKGLVIIGIANEKGPSLADEIASWKKAVTEDGLPWIQVLNNQGIEQSDVTKNYNVNAFPTKILLDPTGKIIGRFTGTSADPGVKDDLTEALKSVMGS
jgi:thiol-disulfide isomerase/thioredoxin